MKLLTPQLSANGRLLPCGQLRQIVNNPQSPLRTQSKTCLRALALAGLQVQFSKAVLGGGQPCPPLKMHRRVNEACTAKPFEVSNLELEVFGDSDPVNLAFRSELAQLLKKIKQDFVQEVIGWAPPLIAEGRPNKPAIVVGNQIVAALHRYFFPGTSMRVHLLDAKPSFHLTPNELAQNVIKQFCPTVNKHRLQIIRSANSMEQAALVAGVCRSTAAAHRAKYGVIQL